MMKAFINGLGSRSSALKTDDELVIEFETLAGSDSNAVEYKQQFEAFLADRRKIKAERRETHRKAPEDAQKGRFQIRG